MLKVVFKHMLGTNTNFEETFGVLDTDTNKITQYYRYDIASLIYGSNIPIEGVTKKVNERKYNIYIRCQKHDGIIIEDKVVILTKPFIIDSLAEGLTIRYLSLKTGNRYRIIFNYVDGYNAYDNYWVLNNYKRKYNLTIDNYGNKGNILESMYAFQYDIQELTVVLGTSIVSVAGLFRYIEPAVTVYPYLNLSNIRLDDCYDFAALFENLKVRRLDFFSANLAKIYRMKRLFGIHSNITLLDFSNCYNDIYNNESGYIDDGPFNLLIQRPIIIIIHKQAKNFKRVLLRDNKCLEYKGVLKDKSYVDTLYSKLVLLNKLSAYLYEI